MRKAFSLLAISFFFSPIPNAQKLSTMHVRLEGADVGVRVFGKSWRFVFFRHFLVFSRIAKKTRRPHDPLQP